MWMRLRGTQRLSCFYILHTHTEMHTRARKRNTLIHYLKTTNQYWEIRRPSLLRMSILIFHNPRLSSVYHQLTSSPTGRIRVCSLDHRTVNVFLIEPEMEMATARMFIARQATPHQRIRQCLLTYGVNTRNPPFDERLKLNGKHNNHITSHDILPHGQL